MLVNNRQFPLLYTVLQFSVDSHTKYLLQKKKENGNFVTPLCPLLSTSIRKIDLQLLEACTLNLLQSGMLMQMPSRIHGTHISHINFVFLTYTNLYCLLHKIHFAGNLQ